MYSRTLAVRRMIDLVTDPSHGYDQAYRDGPDYDCSSAVCEAYGVPHGNTSSIPDIFRSRGAKVLNWDGNMHDLEPGDLVGTKGQHVVMYVGNGKVAEFRINEKGGIVGGKSGDQTGQESRISNWYVPSYGWQYVVSPQGEGQGYDPLDLHYEVHTKEDGWLPQVHALDDYAGVRRHVIDAICIHANAGHSIDYQVHTIGGTWLPVVSSKNANHGNDISGYAGIFGKSIDMIRCYAHNDCKSGERAKYRVSPISKDYFPWQYDHETTNGQDGFAGVVGQAIDRFQIC